MARESYFVFALGVCIIITIGWYADCRHIHTLSRSLKMDKYERQRLFHHLHIANKPFDRKMSSLSQFNTALREIHQRDSPIERFTNTERFTNRKLQLNSKLRNVSLLHLIENGFTEIDEEKLFIELFELWIS